MWFLWEINFSFRLRFVPFVMEKTFQPHNTDHFLWSTPNFYVLSECYIDMFWSGQLWTDFGWRFAIFLRYPSASPLAFIHRQTARRGRWVSGASVFRTPPELCWEFGLNWVCQHLSNNICYLAESFFRLPMVTSHPNNRSIGQLETIPSTQL